MRQFSEDHGVDIEHVKITQFLFDMQWRKLRQYANENGVSLFGDMPIYIALDSSDAWAHPEILLSRTPAPPATRTASTSASNRSSIGTGIS